MLEILELLLHSHRRGVTVHTVKTRQHSARKRIIANLLPL